MEEGLDLGQTSNPSLGTFSKSMMMMQSRSGYFANFNSNKLD